jgi:hypothetical protein
MSTSGGGGMASVRPKSASQRPAPSNKSKTPPVSTSPKAEEKAPPKRTQRPASGRPAASNGTASEGEQAEAEPRFKFSLEFTSVTEQRVQQMVKKAKRHCVKVRKELVILPANRRPKRAALLAASQKAEKYRQSWETLSKLLAAHKENTIQDALAAMRETIINEDNLVKVVSELKHRLPPLEYSEEGAGQAANSMGPLATDSQYGASPAGMSPMKSGGDMYADDSDSTDSEDDMDMDLLGLRGVHA